MFLSPDALQWPSLGSPSHSPSVLLWAPVGEHPSSLREPAVFPWNRVAPWGRTSLRSKGQPGDGRRDDSVNQSVPGRGSSLSEGLASGSAS